MQGQFIIGFITGTLGLFWLGCGMMPGGYTPTPPEIILIEPPTATNHTTLPLPTLETNLTQTPPPTPAQDDGVAAYNLAINKDQTGHPVEAAALYLKAAELGVPQAQYNLGYLHEHGQSGMQQDISLAVQWYGKAADQNLPEAQHMLGVLHTEGRGVPANLATAFSWFDKAAQQDFALAEYQLGVLYTVGQGVEANAEQAAQWFLRAAEQGVPDAQFQIGHRYAQGEGIEQDIILAYAWFHVAAIDGRHQAALEAKRRVHAQMSPEQTTAAQITYSKLLEKLRNTTP